MKKQDPRILNRIRIEFSSGRKHPTSEALRKLVLSAITGGQSAREVAQAAGISQQSIRNWALYPN